MSGNLTVGLWGHALAAILFAALALWQGRRSDGSLQSNALALAFGLTACWALMVAFGGSAARGGEGARDLGWLAFMFLLLRQAEADAERRLAVSALYAVVAAVIGLDLLVQLLRLGADVDGEAAVAVRAVSRTLRLIGVTGALVLVHNLYTAASADTRASLRLPIVALAAMWIFDLNIYTLAWLDLGWAESLGQLRGALLAALAPVFALAARRNPAWKLSLSRKVAFQSLSLLALAFYALLLVGVTWALNALEPGYARVAQVGFVVATTVAALVLLPFDRLRAWGKVKLAKHLFQHRYDYRAEWMRFTQTLGRSDEAAPLDERLVKAIADITDSAAGLLLAPDEGGALAPLAGWNWGPIAADGDGPPFGSDPRIIELDAVRAGAEPRDSLPQWLLDEPRAWVLVPLLHFDRLVGAVALARPPIDRTLDWEDFDLLRVAGRQAASYLAEARGQEALSETRRFDEFNRRFAFVVHDLKNLVSQLTLVARNAERHAENPEFRADMIATLKDSAGRMNELLARLSQHHKGKAEEPRPVPVGALVSAIATARRAQHPIRVGGELELFAMADPARLEQILGHLIQNAIDASPRDEPVGLLIGRRGLDVAIDVVDQGAGMSGEFVRSQLFKPFASTKAGGFGIGAYEARSLAQSMGGRIDVESREGEGSRFTLILPPADAPEQDQAA